MIYCKKPLNDLCIVTIDKHGFETRTTCGKDADFNITNEMFSFLDFHLDSNLFTYACLFKGIVEHEPYLCDKRYIALLPISRLEEINKGIIIQGDNLDYFFYVNDYSLKVLRNIFKSSKKVKTAYLLTDEKQSLKNRFLTFIGVYKYSFK